MSTTCLTERTAPTGSTFWPRLGTGMSLWLVGLPCVLVLGAVLRLIWLSDMEYKADEIWTYEEIRLIRQGEPLPMFGMPTSQEFLNPGLSLWVFLPLAELIQAQSPLDLARAVQILNVLALFGLAAFGLWIAPRAEREVWLWSAALVSVNPLSVLFHRKIWPPSVYPIVILLFLLSWWYRDRRVGAFFWGLIGACLGQIQGAGFFFAAGFALWAALFDRRRVKWLSWHVGSCLGVITMIPWMIYMLAPNLARPPVKKALIHLLEGKFWMRWVLEPFGFGLDYSLVRDFHDFLRYPLVGGQPTYLGLALHIAIGVLAAAVVFLALGRLRRNWSSVSPGAVFVGRESGTAFTQNAALWGYGLVFTASLLSIQRQYMIILFPLQFLWLARLALGSSSDAKKRGRALLAALVVCQALLTFQFLCYVHTQPRIHGDYGVPYREQDRPDNPPQRPTSPDSERAVTAVPSSGCTC